MSETQEEIAKRIHAVYEPNDKNCSYKMEDWNVAKEIKQLQAQLDAQTDVDRRYNKHATRYYCSAYVTKRTACYWGVVICVFSLFIGIMVGLCCLV